MSVGFSARGGISYPPPHTGLCVASACAVLNILSQLLCVRMCICPVVWETLFLIAIIKHQASLAQSICLSVCLSLVSFETMFLCSPCSPGVHSVDHAGLELKDPPASASRVLGLKVCTTAWLIYFNCTPVAQIWVCAH